MPTINKLKTRFRALSSAKNVSQLPLTSGEDTMPDPLEKDSKPPPKLLPSPQIKVQAAAAAAERPLFATWAHQFSPSYFMSGLPFSSTITGRRSPNPVRFKVRCVSLTDVSKHSQLYALYDQRSFDHAFKVSEELPCYYLHPHFPGGSGDYRVLHWDARAEWFGRWRGQYVVWQVPDHGSFYVCRVREGGTGVGGTLVYEDVPPFGGREEGWWERYLGVLSSTWVS